MPTIDFLYDSLLAAQNNNNNSTYIPISIEHIEEEEEEMMGETEQVTRLLFLGARVPIISKEKTIIIIIK